MSDLNEAGDLNEARERWENTDGFANSFPEDCFDAVFTLAAAYMAQQWQPIETAPKDRTVILVYCPTPENWAKETRYRLALWSDCGYGFWCDSTSGIPLSHDPTHFIPLPPKETPCPT